MGIGSLGGKLQESSLGDLDRKKDCIRMSIFAIRCEKLMFWFFVIGFVRLRQTEVVESVVLHTRHEDSILYFGGDVAREN